MEVRYLIMARYAEFGADGKVTIVGGDIEKIFSDVFPAVHPVLLAAARLVLDREDTLSDHSFRSDICTSDGEQITEGVSGTINGVEMPVEMSQLGIGIVLTFGNVVFPKAGWYKMVLYVDDLPRKEFPFRAMTRADEQVLA